MPTVASQAGIYGYGRSVGLAAGVSILAYARTLSNKFTSAPLTSGGPLAINNNYVGKHEFVVLLSGETVEDGYNTSTYFSSTQDTVSSWIICNGNMKINTALFTPPKRKLFMVIYAKGDLIIDGSVSMTARGANHSGTGGSDGYTAPVDIRIAAGNFNDSNDMPVFDPKVPAAGAAGGARATDTTGFGDAFNSGIDGLNGETGGGGTGQAISIPYPDPTITGIAGAGAAGTCFSGGSASGGAYAALSATAGRYGSAGSAGAAGKDVDGFDLSGAFGGAGNPGGAGIREGTAGNDGTGGTLIIICEGALSGTGSVTAKGSNGKYGTIPGVGGASGGGSITVMYGTNPSSAVSLSAAGGLAADDGNFNMGGRGGDGSARKIAIGSN